MQIQRLRVEGGRTYLGDCHRSWNQDEEREIALIRDRSQQRAVQPKVRPPSTRNRWICIQCPCWIRLRCHWPTRPNTACLHRSSCSSLAPLLHASFRPQPHVRPLRFAIPSLPLVVKRNLHLQAVDHARHTKKKPWATMESGPGFSI